MSCKCTCTQYMVYLLILFFPLQASLYVFGGRIDQKATNELWSFDTQTLQWSLLPSHGDSPLSVAGHTATLVDSKMIVLFGYGPERGYTDKVQEYDLSKDTSFIQSSDQPCQNAL